MSSSVAGRATEARREAVRLAADQTCPGGSCDGSLGTPTSSDRWPSTTLSEHPR